MKRLRVPRARRPPHEAPGLSLARLNQFATSVRHILADLPVFAAEKQQRLSLAHHHILDFRNKDGMVASLLRRLQAAFQISEGTAQYWGSLRGTFKARSGFLFGVLVCV